MTISDHLTDVLQDWIESQNDFPLNSIRCPYWPIPFFGNPATALVATVGVNPSSTEFEFSRGWADVKTPADWERRLRDYFNHRAPPHDWFKPWRAGLKLLDLSYEEGTATHFDVSYRPTSAMLTNGATDRLEFGRMVERDVAWLFRLLPLCENLRLLLLFGPVLRPDGSIENLTQFLRQQAPQYGFNVLENGELRHTETGRVFFLHEADTGEKETVTCRVVKNLSAHRDELLRQIM